MAPTVTASTSTHLSQPGTLASRAAKKSRSFKSKSGGLHNIGLTLSARARKRAAAAPSPRIDVSNPHLPARDRQRLAQLEKTLPKLNGVVPAGVTKARGGKKGKRFVEDKQSMLEILRLVNEVKEEKIEEKLEKGRQLEALREARRKEQDARDEQRKSRLERAKDKVRGKRAGGQSKFEEQDKEEVREKKAKAAAGKTKKRVSFA
ncbi:60S ribosomal subunit assembly/export protein loc1 [Tirmania nivea]|nr:60S ribosomal subunit assembly/export protein loc1 [Tirmania nivea]